MMSRTVAAGLLAAATFTAVAGGSYVAVRQNRADAVPLQPAPEPPPTAPPETVKTETEALVIPAVADSPAPAVDTPAEKVADVLEPARPAPKSIRRPTTRSTPRKSPPVAPTSDQGVPVIISTPEPPPTVPVERVAEVPVAEPDTIRPAEPVREELVVPASAVIGLEIEGTITSEQAQLEDRVNARVTRDVYADGHLAIPSGSRVIGNVSLVERGGKMKDRARLGVRFHTLVLADGQQIPLRTEPIYREGDSPGAESSRKIGGAAVGGAVLGAILGGGKGAVAGAAAGAAGGTAAVMAGGRNAATLAAGSVVTVRLSSPVAVEISR